jgi:hypothetical protein
MARDRIDEMKTFSASTWPPVRLDIRLLTSAESASTPRRSVTRPTATAR